MSSKHIVMISLSEIIPSARNTINKGTGFRTLGIFTTIFLNVEVVDIIFTDNVRIGFDAFSETERISAEYKYLSSPDLRIYNILSPNFSWDTTVFSFPRIIKYPPWSLRHSPIVCLISDGNPDNTQ